jgi:hypothetical protein
MLEIGFFPRLDSRHVRKQKRNKGSLHSNSEKREREWERIKCATDFMVDTT